MRKKKKNEVQTKGIGGEVEKGGGGGRWGVFVLVEGFYIKGMKTRERGGDGFKKKRRGKKNKRKKKIFRGRKKKVALMYTERNSFKEKGG